ncbi:MAG: hypothetical protein M9920_01245 [Verrucomicrobiae bacterium]|nr:hypothetical protein [Verrucomicrobiae bacterium]
MKALQTKSKGAEPASNQPRSARQFPWTKDEDALLGRLTDREVAEKLNRTLGAVRDQRKFLGKTAVGHAPQPLRMEREPRDRYARLFATKSNLELRAILGWSYKRIYTRRRQLAGGQVRKQRPEWTLEEDRLLGTKPDQVLARKFGRSVKSVRARRGHKRIRVKKDWRPEDDKVLGTRVDHEVALLLGRSPGNVGWRRKRLGIPPKAKARPWTPEEEALLGSMPDGELARKFGRTVAAVEGRRIQLGRAKPDAAFKVIKIRVSGDSRTPPANPVNAKSGAAYCTWTAEEDALLGQLTDEAVARKLGYSVKRVRRRRWRLGLWNPNPRHRHWTKSEIALLGTAPDREIAALVNRSLENVRCKRLALGIPFHNTHYEIWKPDELALLGKLPDSEVAQRTGHSLKSVRQARTKRRIPSVQKAAPNWRPEEDALLGTAPDAEIARRLQRTLAAVKFRRSKKGIPASRG